MSLTLRFSALLFLFLALTVGTYFAVSLAVDAKEYDSVVVNLAGRQRMLTQKYAREINQVLVGLAVSDQELVTEMKEAASLTAARYEGALAALLEGGEVDTEGEGRIWIPSAQGVDVTEHLSHVRTEWEELRRIASRTMQLDILSQARSDHVRSVQTQTARAVAEMDQVVLLMQRQSEARLRRVDSYTICACIVGVVLFACTVVFVRRRIVAPLDESLIALATEINERKHAEEEARRADAAKSNFLANMSHEIRTPMTAILGYADVMLEHGDLNDAPPERIEAARTIRRNGENLLGIINDILDLSKIEAGKMTIQSNDCRPCRIVAEVASLMRVRADSKGISIKIEYAGPIPETIQCDAIRLRQVLTNLMANAIKFTEVGVVRLVIRFVSSGDEPTLQFDVIDTGRGMTQEQKGVLFQPFMQADTSTTRCLGGTGLGLSISKRFAELLGGDVTVIATEMGVGSTFRATVAAGLRAGATMLDDPMSATVVADTADRVAQVGQTDLAEVRVLLAEDSPDIYRLLSLFLKKAGAEVTIAENGELAVEAALEARDSGKPFDIILMDIQMPLMNGYEATVRLRRKGYTGAIIALTANAMEGDREKYITAGCDDYATKPINHRKLIETIQMHLAPAEVGALVAT